MMVNSRYLLLSLKTYHSDKRFIVFNCLEHGLLSGQATLSKYMNESVDDFEFNHFYTTTWAVLFEPIGTEKSVLSHLPFVKKCATQAIPKAPTFGSLVNSFKEFSIFLW